MMNSDMSDFHWAMQVIGDLDAGLIVLDNDYQVCAWNDFMQSYSGITSDKILGLLFLMSSQNCLKNG